MKKKLKSGLRNFILRIIGTPEQLNGAVIVGENKHKLQLGHNVSFGGEVYLHADAPISIGEGSMIGYGCVLHTSTHDYNDNPMWTKRIDRPIKIGKHVWIGTKAIILNGVIIEDYAVIGAGSVISKNVPKGAIVSGNPARIIKFRDEKLMNMPYAIENTRDSKIIKEDYLSEFYHKIE